MSDFKAIMERIAEEFPLPAQQQHHSDDTHQGSGAWENDTMEDWLRTMGDQHSEFQYEKTNRRDGWRIYCPGNTAEGWPDGASHSEFYSEPNDSTIVFVDNGIPCLSCKHNGCNDGAKEGRKSFRHLLDALDPHRELFDYPHVGDADLDELLQAFGAEGVDAGKSAASAAPLGKNSQTHIRVEEFTQSAAPSGTNPDFVAKIQTESPDNYPVEGARHQNDTGVARRLVHYSGNDILFVEDKNAWYAWDGRRWVEDKQRVRMTQKAKSVVEAMLIEAENMPSDTEEERDAVLRFVRWVLKMQDTNKLDAVVKNATSEARRINMMDFNPDRLLFNTMNGTVDLRTGMVRDYDRRDLITRVSPIPFKPGAERAPFEKFLREIFPSSTEEKIGFLKRWMGYCLTGLCDEEAFLTGYGTGRNGKGKLNDIFMHIFGDDQKGGYGHTANFDIFVTKKGDEGRPHDIADMHG
jgi:hypothetical protein